MRQSNCSTPIPPAGSHGVRENIHVIKKGGALKKGWFWWLYRAGQVKIKVIRIPGQQQKSDVPGGARGGGGMGAEQFDRRKITFKVITSITKHFGHLWFWTTSVMMSEISNVRILSASWFLILRDCLCYLYWIYNISKYLVMKVYQTKLKVSLPCWFGARLLFWGLLPIMKEYIKNVAKSNAF